MQNGYFGNSFDPTIVMLRPIWTVTGLSPTLTIVLPLRYQPSEPVENSFTSASMVVPPMLISTAFA